MSQSKPLHFRLCLASPGGFEPLTPRLGGECSIQLSYEDMSDFWLKIGLSATFQASGSVTGYSITYTFWMNCSIQLSSIHSPLVASYITLTLTDSNYRVLFPLVQRRQASSFLRRRSLYPAELQKHNIYDISLRPSNFILPKRKSQDSIPVFFWFLTKIYKNYCQILNRIFGKYRQSFLKVY